MIFIPAPLQLATLLFQRLGPRPEPYLDDFPSCWNMTSTDCWIV